MALESWHNFFVIVGWSAAFIAAVGGLGSWITGSMIDKAKNKEIAVLETQVQSLGPRTLNADQKQKLIEKLKTYNDVKRIGFYSRMMDRESAAFADILSETFKEAGWDVALTNRSSLNDFPGFLSIFTVGKPPKTLVKFILEAFQEIGVDCHSENIKENSLSGKRELDRVYIVVGSKI